MTEIDDLEVEVARLREQLSSTRKDRMAAQKRLISKPVLDKALERVERDRSSSANEQTEKLRAEINTLRDSFHSALSAHDHTRDLFIRTDRSYGALPARERMVAALNAEAIWRKQLATDPMVDRLRLVVTTPKELS